MIRRVLCQACLYVAAGSILTAQQQPSTRQEQLEQERLRKAEMLKPEVPTKAEKLFDRFGATDMFGKLTGTFPGLRLRVGQLVTGSGFALGPEYYRPDLATGNVVFRTGLSASIRRYYKIDSYLGFPHISSNRFAAEIYAMHFDAPQMPYFGPGRTTRREARTSYRKEETSLDFKTGWRPTRRTLLIGVTGGVLAINTGPGKDRRFPNIDERFQAFENFSAVAQPGQFAGTVPGLRDQTNYLRGGVFLDIDNRDLPGDPHKGTHIESSFTYYKDRDYGLYTFRRLEFSAEEYIPFLNRKRVIALRAKTQLSYRNPGQIVPFYVQPTLGGSDDLRGFNQFRFYDNNLVVTNAEYRWEVFPALDMAAFFDAGKVFNRMAEFDLRHAAVAYGLGFRLKTRESVAVRLDVGRSREGYRVWLKFNNVF